MASPVSTLAASAYSIHIGDSSAGQLATFLKQHKFSSIFILADENSLQHCLPLLVSKVKKLTEAEIIELESGEENKTIEICMQVWRVLGELGADRNSLLINLGGGVITDMGGFIASAFKRGIAFVNIPTTLLAQIDASAGGKTGVDLEGLKNEIGLFADPKEVFIMPSFLRTLPERQLISGYAEALKHGLIADASYWEFLKTTDVSDESSWEELIRRSVQIKLDIVLADPKESGLRKRLNFGHTIGHALETFFLERAETTLLHGEAVAAGMICEAYLSVKKSGLSEEALEEITNVILNEFAAIDLDAVNDNRIVEIARHDKKNASGEINCTLLAAIGEAVINKKIAAEDIVSSLKYYRSAVHRFSIS